MPDGGWLHVGRFAYQLSRRGYRPHLVDSFIAIAAIHNEIPLWSADKDFTRIAALTELKLFEPAS
jgi:predicted nucleic acid-binding protein